MTDAIDDTPSEAEMLLPWYAAGTATPEESAIVEAALARDERLRHSLALIREDIDATISGNDAVPMPRSHAFERLAAGMVAHPRREASTGGLLGWISDKLAALAPRQLAFASVAAAVIVLAQAALVGGLLLHQERGGTFETASRGDQATAPVAGPAVLLSFVPGASAADVTAFLQRHSAAIVNGPMAGGMYRVRIGTAPLDEAETNARVAAMRNETAVVRAVLPAR
jgi:hypothetical protein